MSSRTEREKQKAQQEKFQAVLSNLLKDDDNKYCVDCDAKGKLIVWRTTHIKLKITTLELLFVYRKGVRRITEKHSFTEKHRKPLRKSYL